jgi:hypothetical protein
VIRDKKPYSEKYKYLIEFGPHSPARPTGQLDGRSRDLVVCISSVDIVVTAE